MRSCQHIQQCQHQLMRQRLSADTTWRLALLCRFTDAKLPLLTVSHNERHMTNAVIEWRLEWVSETCFVGSSCSSGGPLCRNCKLWWVFRWWCRVRSWHCSWGRHDSRNAKCNQVASDSSWSVLSQTACRALVEGTSLFTACCCTWWATRWDGGRQS